MIQELDKDGSVYCVANEYEADGRVSWHARSARGFAYANCYLLREGSNVLMIDTGLTVHRDQVLSDLESFLTPADTLAILLLRQGEYDSVCNLHAIAARHRIDAIYGQFDNPMAWADVGTEATAAPPLEENREIKSAALRTSGVTQFEFIAGRTMHVLLPNLRLLKTHWVFDEKSGTFFSSDMFTYLVHSQRGHGLLVDDEHPEGTEDMVRTHLEETRYWWLSGASVGSLIEEVQEFRNRFSIKRIAPSYGRVIAGEKEVERHFDLLIDAIQNLAQQPATIRRS